jgi:hypothetical protein
MSETDLRPSCLFIRHSRSPQWDPRLIGGETVCARFAMYALVRHRICLLQCLLQTVLGVTLAWCSECESAVFFCFRSNFFFSSGLGQGMHVWCVGF